MNNFKRMGIWSFAERETLTFFVSNLKFRMFYCKSIAPFKSMQPDPRLSLLLPVDVWSLLKLRHSFISYLCSLQHVDFLLRAVADLYLSKGGGGGNQKKHPLKYGLSPSKNIGFQRKS